MHFLSKFVRGSLLAGVSLMALVVATPTHAGIVALEQYEFQGQAGSETTLAASSTATGILGMSVGESSGLTPSAGTNSISSSGWNLAGQYYSLGFTVEAGYTATITQLILTSRSSGTGPGVINVLASVNGAAFSTVASITQTSTNYNDEILSITPVTATQGQSVVFEFVAANQTDAAGTGSIGSAGTFRIGDYNPSGTPTPFTINGTITPNAVVPEPATASLVAVGLALVTVANRRRFRIS